MLLYAYNKALLILDAEQYCHYSCNDVVTDELPAGAVYWVAVRAMETVLGLERLTSHF